MSLLGKPFRGYVQAQIDRREEALGRGPTIGLNNDVSKTFFQNVPWIRLSSGVDLTNEETITLPPLEEYQNPSITFNAINILTNSPSPVPNTFTRPISGSVLDKLKERGYSENEIKGAELATNFVLFGGSISQEGDANTIGQSAIKRYSGIRGTSPWGGAYGFGLPSDISGERGYVPMPGIESVDFSYKNDGALAQATVKIKCYSRSQFEIIDVLYMRPGYTVLLEFGHSVFIDNKNPANVARAGEGEYSFYTDPFLAMNGKISFSELKSKILNEKEKWNGNYEGFYAKITKFNWSFSDNVYNITINLVGFGDVISSLNAAPSPSFETLKEALDLRNKDKEKIEESQTAIVSQALKSSLNAQLFTLFLREEGRIKERKRSFSETLIGIKQNPPELFDLDITKDFNDKKALYPNGLKYKNYNENTGEITIETFTGSFPDSLFQVLDVKEEGNKSKRDAYYPNMYISFGAFCAILQNEINLFTGTGEEFLINIDINYANLSEDKNIMRVFPGMFSADPSKVLIPYRTHQGHTDSSVLSSGRDLDDIFFSSSIIRKLINLSPKFYIDNNKGRLAHVLLDMAYLADVVSSNVSKNEDTLTISPQKILENILSTINETTGGINNFKVIEDTDTGFIKIVSEIPQDNDTNLKSINSYGFTGNNFSSPNIKGSFVKSLNLSSELSDAFATQISVGAQNNSSQQGGNGASFSEYNKGLIDRIIPEKLSTNPDSTANPSPPKTLEEVVSDLVISLTPVYKISSSSKAKINRITAGTYLGGTTGFLLTSIYNLFTDDTFQWDSETIGALLNINKNYASLLTGINAKEQYAPIPFYIPFNLSLDLLGLGGLRIYDGFKFDGKVLPISYQPKNIKLIIKSLSHNVSVDGWTTKVETLAQPISKLRKPENFPSPQNTTLSTSTPSTNATPPGNPNTTETLQQLIAKLESNNNYNIVVGGKIDPDLTKRTVEQNKAIYGNRALGKYQIQYNTFKDAWSGNTNIIFSATIQDQTYFKLLNRRKLKEYQNGIISIETFARNLSKEWAALPQGPDNLSYYAGDGKNRALTTWDTVLQAIRNTYG